MARDALNSAPKAKAVAHRGLPGLLPALAAWLLAVAPAPAEETMVLYNWTTYFPPDLLNKFEAETGIRVITEFFESNETMLANVETGVGNYDVIVPSDYMVRIMIDRGLLQPIHASGMENFKIRQAALR